MYRTANFSVGRRVVSPCEPKPVASYGDCAPMGLDYSSSDGQSQTCVAYPATTRLVSTVEAVEDVGKVCGVDADPVIGYRDSQRLVAFQPSPEQGLPAGLGAKKGVAQDVSQCLAHAHPVDVHIREVSGCLQRQFNPSSLRLRLPAVHVCRDQLVNRARF